MRKRKKNKYKDITKNPTLDDLADISREIHENPLSQTELNELNAALYTNMKNTVSTHNLAYAMKHGTKNIDVLSAAQAVWLEGEYEPRFEADPYEKNPTIYEYNLLKNKDEFLVSEIKEDNMLYAQELLDDHNIPFEQLYEFSTNFQNIGHMDILAKSLNDSPDAQYQNSLDDIVKLNDLGNNGERIKELEANLKQFDDTYEMDVAKLGVFTPIEDCQYTLEDTKERISYVNNVYRKNVHNTAVRANLMYENEPENIAFVIAGPKNIEKYDEVSETFEESVTDPENAKYLVYVQINKDKQPEYRVISGEFEKINTASYNFKSSTGVNLNVGPNHKQQQLFPVNNLRDAEHVIQSKMFMDSVNLQKKYQGNLLNIYKDFGPTSSKAMKPVLHNVQEAMTVIDKNVIKYLETTIEKPLEKVIDDPVAGAYESIDDERTL